MADLGTIGRNGSKEAASPDLGPRLYFRGIAAGSNWMTLGGRDDAEGSPSAPSLRMDSRGTFSFYWVVDAGTITFSVDVKQAANLSPRPRVTIQSNSAIGVNADVHGSAASGAGWVTVNLDVTPTSSGLLKVTVENRLDTGAAGTPCYWDNFTEQYA